MRNIIYLVHVSLDGFTSSSGPGPGLEWVYYDEELEAYSHSLHEQTDAAIYGRVTYEGMQSYWPTVLDDPNADPAAMAHARWYDAATKIVISKTLTEVPERTVVIGDHFTEEINKIKQQPGKDIWLLGSPSTGRLFMELDLIDEYRINVNPTTLPDGRNRLFEGLQRKLALKLVEAKQFKSGVVGLKYVRGE